MLVKRYLRRDPAWVILPQGNSTVRAAPARPSRCMILRSFTRPPCLHGGRMNRVFRQSTQQRRSEMPSRARLAIQNGLLVLAAVAFSLPVSELCLRALGYSPLVATSSQEITDYLASWSAYDPELGWTNRPSVRQHYVDGWFTTLADALARDPAPRGHPCPEPHRRRRGLVRPGIWCFRPGHVCVAPAEPVSTLRRQEPGYWRLRRLPIRARASALPEDPSRSPCPRSCLDLAATWE